MAIFTRKNFMMIAQVREPPKVKKSKFRVPFSLKATRICFKIIEKNIIGILNRVIKIILNFWRFGWQSIMLMKNTFLFFRTVSAILL
jgi:hypothetical protein